MTEPEALQHLINHDHLSTKEYNKLFDIKPPPFRDNINRAVDVMIENEKKGKADDRG